MDIYELQNNEHRRFMHMVSVLDRNDAKASFYLNNLIKKTGLEILSHAMAEEEAFLKPLAEKAPELKEIISSSENDHKTIEGLFDSLLASDPTKENWPELLKEISTVLEQDIKKEEEIMHPKAKKIFSDNEAKEMADRMIILKQQFETSILKRLGHKLKEVLGLETV